MRNRSLLLIILLPLFASYKSNAQSDHPIRDSLTKYFKEKPSISTYLDGKYSFIESFPSKMFGLFMGLNWGGRVDLGFCFYNSYDEPLPPIYLKKGTPLADTFYRNIYFNYTSLRAEYTFYKTRNWEFNVPVSIGVGKGNIDDFDKVGEHYSPRQSQKATIVPLEVGANGIYLIWKWLGMSAGLSYRANLSNFKHYEEFSAMNYTFGVSVRFGTLYKMAKSKLTKK